MAVLLAVRLSSGTIQRSSLLAESVASLDAAEHTRRQVLKLMIALPLEFWAGTVSAAACEAHGIKMLEVQVKPLNLREHLRAALWVVYTLVVVCGAYILLVYD